MALIVQLHEGVAVNKCSLDQPKLRIGRNPDCDIFIDDAVVSSEHAVIEKIETPEPKGSAEYYLEDQNSTNGKNSKKRADRSYDRAEPFEPIGPGQRGLQTLHVYAYGVARKNCPRN